MGANIPSILCPKINSISVKDLDISLYLYAKPKSFLTLALAIYEYAACTIAKYYMSEDAKHTTLKGLFWNAIDRFGFQAIISIVMVIVARILPVDDLAIIAVLSVFTVIATSIVDSGLATSLVRSKVVDEKDYSSMFVFNLAVSTILYLILFFIAPGIEAYYQIPGLALYARVLFLQLIVHALGIVQYVKILKSMQFNITARVNVTAVFLSGAIAVALAVLGFGPWALILQPVLYSTFRTAMFWVWGNWKVDFTLSKSSLKKHLEFSVTFMLANLMGKVLTPLYSALVGKYYSPLETGYYYQANKWGETPNLLISSIIQGTTLSTLTPIQDDAPRFLNACRKTMSTLAFVLFPVSFLAISIAEPAFVLVLTEKYRHAVGYFQILCLAGIFISFTDMNINFVNIKGKSKHALALEITKLALALLLLVLTYDKGIWSIIYGQLLVRVLCYIVSMHFSQRIYGYAPWVQLRDIASSLWMGGTAAACSFLPIYFSVYDHLFGLIVLQSVIFVSVYCGLCHWTKNAIWVELLQLAKSKILKQGI